MGKLSPEAGPLPIFGIKAHFTAVRLDDRLAVIETDSHAARLLRREPLKQCRLNVLGYALTIILDGDVVLPSPSWSESR